MYGWLWSRNTNSIDSSITGIHRQIFSLLGYRKSCKLSFRMSYNPFVKYAKSLYLMYFPVE